MMKVIIIDDELAMHYVMRKSLAKLHHIEIVGSFQDTASASLFIQENDVHMAFVDISMPDESGMSFAQRMAEQRPDLHIVFVTSHKEYAMDAFDVYALDYIVKPVSLERIERSVKRAMAIQRFMEMDEDDKGNNQIDIYGLGGLEVRSGTTGYVKWRSRKSAELFGYLLMNRGRMISRARIVSDVFGEMPQKNAVTYLNTTIYQMRKSLQPHGLKSVILSDHDVYGLDIAQESIDFVLFEDGLKRFAVIDANNLYAALEIEDLYAGDLFGEKAYLWALNDIERLSSLYAVFVKKLASVLLEHQMDDTAVRLLNKLLSYNEWDEETVQLLLSAYAAQKDKISLTRVFKRYEKNLRKELDTAPSKELVHVYAQLQADVDIRR
ncbi:response regulator [Paenibacillus mendelii]|uniref:Response regulator n=1 Tax=Paenibacillus mendelii TaxID=206163 RepID=A0ABV6JCI3_9BACL|nr:response regulator [Paenibacillus mendelii]MCQ6561599.1 response regulator [Paenibacillus mendelii]